MSNVTTGECIQRARVRAGLSRVDLASRAGIGLNTLIRYEKGQTTPKEKKLEAIAKALGLTKDELLVRTYTVAEPLPPDVRDAFRKALSRSSLESHQASFSRLSSADRHLGIQIHDAYHAGDRDLLFRLARQLSDRLGELLIVSAREEFEAALRNPESTDLAHAALVLGMAVVGATGVSVALHEHDHGGIEYTRARALEPGAPSEELVTFAKAALAAEPAGSDGAALARAILERARAFADKYRAAYTMPYYRPTE